MLGSLTGDEIAAEAKMVRAAFAGAIVLVEGESDHKTFEKLLEISACSILPTHGRTNLLDALSTLENQGFDGIVGIADADFWHINGGIPTSSNLLTTDKHDLEMMMLTGRTLDAVIDEFGSEMKIARFFAGQKIRTPITWLLHEAEFLGRLRLVSEVQDISLKFTGLNYSRFVSRINLRLDKHKCLAAVLVGTADPSITVAIVEAGLSALPARLDRTQLCRGHDLTEILSIGLRNAWASHPKAVAKRDIVERLLRLAFTSTEFEKSQLYAQAVIWQASNYPYHIVS